MTTDTTIRRCFYTPYKDYQQNHIYNLLFCDNLEIFKKADVGHWPVLLASEPNPEELLKIANDLSVENRQRILAFNRLRECHVNVPAKQILCTVFEVSMHDGLDTLAVFSGRQIRYINYSGKMFFYELGPDTSYEDSDRQKMTDEFDRLGKVLFIEAQDIVNKIGPWDKFRLPPPKDGMCRMTFLASDGLYFGQGRLDDLLKDSLARPFVMTNRLLLDLINKASTKYGGKVSSVSDASSM